MRLESPVTKEEAEEVTFAFHCIFLVITITIIFRLISIITFIIISINIDIMVTFLILSFCIYETFITKEWYTYLLHKEKYKITFSFLIILSSFFFSFSFFLFLFTEDDCMGSFLSHHLVWMILFQLLVWINQF